jgi:hypothetical protein
MRRGGPTRHSALETWREEADFGDVFSMNVHQKTVNVHLISVVTTGFWSAFIKKQPSFSDFWSTTT